jgi:DNA-binding transcriptional MerR regulator
MQISALAERGGTTTRAIRYYEQQGLLPSRRLPNGYRDYDESAVTTIEQIRLLLDAGLPTRVIALILPCMEGKSVDVCPQVQSLISQTVHDIQQRMDELAAKRTKLIGVLEDSPGSGADHR